jgi:CRISPR-associated endonuclease/helicase Cas3
MWRVIMSVEKRLYSFSECWSHDGGRRLRDHLEQVARSIREELSSNPLDLPPRFCDVAFLVGLFHDLGKASWFFQEKLRSGRDEGELSHHSLLSAVLSFHLIGDFFSKEESCNDKDFLQTAATIAIFRHHTDLKDWREESMRIFRDKELIKQQLERTDIEGMNEWLGEFNISEERILSSFDGYTFQDTILDNLEERSWGYSHSLWFLYLYSLLISSDKLEAAFRDKRRPKRRDLPKELVADYKKERFGSPKTGMDSLRYKIAEEVMKELENNPEGSLYTITAPTGSGKTLIGLESAIWLRERLKEEKRSGRIIYCLPYTSIIDQNFDVYEDVLKRSKIKSSSEILLKHHHIADMSFKIEGEPDPYDEELSNLLVESWSSEIVVTTFVQLFDTLFSGRNSAIKRFSQLAGSVLILDEVQAIPRGYWETVREIFIQLAKQFKTKILLLTATRPLIFQDGDARELLTNKEQYFSALSRIRLYNYASSTIEFDDFCKRMASSLKENPSKDILIILNTIKSSIDLYKYLKNKSKHKPYYLSTNITPKERKKRIKEIKRRTKQPKLIISTQMVEAGVDLSADIVHRDFAPLDCIIQSCGRCNRNSEKGEGRVYLWRVTGTPPFNKEGFCKIYERGSGSTILLDATESALGSKKEIEEKEFLMLAEAYFQSLKDRCASSRTLSYLPNMEFGTLGEEFQLIEDDKSRRQSYFVIDRKDDPESEKVWEKYTKIREMTDHLQRHKEFLKLKREFFERVINVWRRAGEPVSKDILPIYSEQEGAGGYSPETGYIYGEKEGHLIC